MSATGPAAEPPLPELMVYNPHVLDRADLIKQFVVRRSLLDRIIDDLRRTSSGSAPQHHLILGRRGMGKTTLLRRIRFAIEDDAELSNQWLPLTFPEEQYSIAGLSDLWVNSLDALGDSLESEGEADAARRIDEAIDALPHDEPPRAMAARRLLTDWIKERDTGLVLLLDNIDLILDRLGDQDWALREVMSTESRLAVVGATTQALETTYTYGGAFYDFFELHELRGLDDDDAAELLSVLASQRRVDHVQTVIQTDRGRLRALNSLTGGNPRTLVLLFEALADDEASAVRINLERLLDRCTPVYKARFESLPAQARALVHTLALNWDPMTAIAVAEHRNVRMDVNAVSAQLNRLQKSGVVEKVAYPPSKKAAFQVGERLFNIWYLMRASRKLRRKLVWLVEFLRMLYSEPERGRRGASLVREEPSPYRGQRDSTVRLLSERGDLASRLMSETDYFEDTLAFCTEAVRSGRAEDVAVLLEDSDHQDRQRPLYEALMTIVENSSDRLYRLAPEIRRPAEELVRRLMNEADAERLLRAPRGRRRRV